MAKSSQVDKFYKKWNKDQSDMHILHQQELERQKAMKEEPSMIPGEKELSAEGNIKEAAMVLSHEGMNVFSQIFANSVETAISKALPQILERTIDRKVTEILEGAVEGMRLFATQMSNPIVQQIEDQVERKLSLIKFPIVQEPAQEVETVDPIIEEPKEDIKTEMIKIQKSKRQPNKKVHPYKGMTKDQISKILVDELRMVTDKMIRAGKPLHHKEITSLCPEVHWGTSVWSKMNKLIQLSEGLIEKSPHQKGYYQIKEIV